MNPIFIFILCTALAFTDTHAALDSVQQKIAGGAALLVTAAGGTIIYLLLKSKATSAQQIKELEAENKILKEAIQVFEKESDEAIEAAYQIGLIFGRQSEITPPDTLLGTTEKSNTATPQELTTQRDQEKERLHRAINTTKSDLQQADLI